MILQIVKLNSSLSQDELTEKALERKPQFESIPGLLQKYYVKFSEGNYGGIYVWDNQESLEKFKVSELAATIPEAYQVIEAPNIELAEILFQLRNE